MLVGTVLLICWTTLAPGDGGWRGTSELCLICGDRGLADTILNIALFVPLGAGLVGIGASPWLVLGAGAALSLPIELLQVAVVPGRDASAGDLLANTVGAGIGGAVVVGWRWQQTASRQARATLSLLTGATTLAGLVVGLTLMTPQIPEPPYAVEWTPDLPGSPVYRGAVSASGVGGLELAPSGVVSGREDSVRALLAAGSSVRVEFTAVPRPNQPTPLWVLRASGRQEVAYIGLDNDDILFRYRPLAAGIRLDRPTVRFPGALASAESGSHVDLTVESRYSDYCAVVNGSRRCVRGLTAGDTWMLLMSRSPRSLRLRGLIGLFWIGLLFVPAGVLAKRRRDVSLTGVLVVSGLVILRATYGGASIPLVQMLAAASGLLVGRATGVALDPHPNR